MRSSGLGCTVIRFALLLSLYPIGSQLAFPQNLQGTWQGTLSGPGYSLPLRFELDGRGGGTLKSPTQNFTGALTYSPNGNQIEIRIPSAHAKFEATVTGDEMTGTWSQLLLKRPLHLARNGNPKDSVPPQSSPAASSSESITPDVSANNNGGIAGTWTGGVLDPSNGYPISVVLNAAGSGVLLSTTTRGLPSGAITYAISGDRVSLKFLPESAVYEGTITGNKMNGVLTRNGRQATAELRKVNSFCLKQDCTQVLQAFQGAWKGTIPTQPALPLTLTLRPDGSGTVESSSEAVNGPLGYLITSENSASIAMPTLDAILEVRLDNGRLAGEWARPRDSGAVQVPFVKVGSEQEAQMEALQKEQDALAGKITPSDDPAVIGAWYAKIPLPEESLFVTFHIRGAGVGVLMSAMWQGEFQYTLNGSRITFKIEVPSSSGLNNAGLNATFDGAFSADRITGTWTSNGTGHPLTLFKDFQESQKTSSSDNSASEAPTAYQPSGNADCDALRKIVAAAPGNFQGMKPLQQAPDTLNLNGHPAQTCAVATDDYKCLFSASDFGQLATQIQACFPHSRKIAASSDAVQFNLEAPNTVKILLIKTADFSNLDIMIKAQ